MVKTMKYSKFYTNQVGLLLDVLPCLNQFKSFALKGGTAINLFYQNMPRLSVDIDLAYLPIEPREVFLSNIQVELTRLKRAIEGEGLVVKESNLKNGMLAKLMVFREQSVIKIEPNFVIRGNVMPCEQRELCSTAQNEFLRYVEVQSLSQADVYGGKLCAALDRGHPRDLFDVKLFFENYAFDETTKYAFLVYLLSSPRPINEMLSVNINKTYDEFESTYNKQFLGMTALDIELDELIEVDKSLRKNILSRLNDEDKKFLLSFKKGEPNWSLFPFSGVQNFPSVQWKLNNINKIPEKKREALIERLNKVLYC